MTYTGAALYRLSQQANWELIIMLIPNKCKDLNFFSGLIFTTDQVVFITAKITFKFTSLPAV